ncbi:2845_t:CDS:2, partial [Gigaspora rosea]
MGNGQKAQHKRERAKGSAQKTASTQVCSIDDSTKVDLFPGTLNEAAKTVICKVCRNTFLCTVRQKALKEHAENKHSKNLEECFPGFTEIKK